MQLHQMADTTIATGLKKSMVKLGISVILLPSSASEITVAVSTSGVVESTAMKTAKTNSNAIWVAVRAAGIEPFAPRSHSPLLNACRNDRMWQIYDMAT
ncbi:hypothetical protein A3K88_21780 [Pseudomonas putida]|nr:hypothetical protein A3K88_21780 [Pseudomonas putida]